MKFQIKKHFYKTIWIQSPLSIKSLMASQVYPRYLLRTSQLEDKGVVDEVQNCYILVENSDKHYESQI